MTTTPTPRTVPATIFYVLSEQGRRASLAAGGTGTLKQRESLDLPVELLDQVSVDSDGTITINLSYPANLGNDQTYSEAYDAPLTDPLATLRDVLDRQKQKAAAEKEQRAQREAEERARRDARTAVARRRAEAWAARPLSERVIDGDLATRTNLSVDADDTYTGPLATTGNVWVGREDLADHAPAALAEALAERDRHLARVEQERERKEKAKAAHIGARLMSLEPALGVQWADGLLCRDTALTTIAEAVLTPIAPEEDAQVYCHDSRCPCGHKAVDCVSPAAYDRLGEIRKRLPEGATITDYTRVVPHTGEIDEAMEVDDDEPVYIALLTVPDGPLTLTRWIEL